MKMHLFIILIVIPVILSSLTFELEKIDEFAESGDYGQFQRLIIEDNYMYAISIYGFEINSINEFSGELTRISLIPLEGIVDGIEKIGTNVFVSNRTTYQTEIYSTIYKIDVFNPFEPFVADSIIFPENEKNDILRTYGDYLAYHKLEEINNGFFFTELVFMDPISFEEVTAFIINLWTLPLRDNYFLKQRNYGEYIFDVYDYSDIYNIHVVSSVDFESCPISFMISNAIDDSTLVLMGNYDIAFYDFSDIYNIELISTYNRLSNASPLGNCIRIDDFLMIPSQNAGIEVVDISDIENPIMFDFYEYPLDIFWQNNPYFSTTGDLVNDDNYLYVGTCWDGIMLMSHLNGTIEYINLYINNRTLKKSFNLYNDNLIATGYSHGLYVYDIEELSSPILDMVIFEDLYVISAKVIDDIIVLITLTHLDENHHLYIYDINDLSDPTLLYYELLDGSTIIQNNENEQNSLYICSIDFNNTSKITKYNISDPQNIEQIMIFEYPSLGKLSFFNEGYLYFLKFNENGTKDLLIYNGFEDENPELINQIFNFTSNTKIYKLNNYLNVSKNSNTEGDLFYSLDDPLNPELAFTLQNSSKWRGCKLKDNVLFSPSGYTVYLYDIEGNPSGELEPFDYFNLNSKYHNINFFSQDDEDYFFCMQLECISTYNYSIETSAENELLKPETTLSNYPNPFNPDTTIRFNVIADCNVQIDVFNIKGQKINSLVNEQLLKGEHSITWNGENTSGKKVGSGLYLYKLIVNGKTEIVKKCMLLK